MGAGKKMKIEEMIKTIYEATDKQMRKEAEAAGKPMEECEIHAFMEKDGSTYIIMGGKAGDIGVLVANVVNNMKTEMEKRIGKTEAEETMRYICELGIKGGR